MRSYWAVSLFATVLAGMPLISNAKDGNSECALFLAQQPKIERSIVDGLEVTNIVIDQSKGNNVNSKASSTKNKSNSVVKAPPKDGNEGTYPTAGSSKNKKHVVKDIPAPKDGTEGTYPTANLKPKSVTTSGDQFTIKIQPNSGSSVEKPNESQNSAVTTSVPKIGEPGFKYDSGILDDVKLDKETQLENSDVPGKSNQLDSLTSEKNIQQKASSESSVPENKVLSVPYVPKDVQTVVGNINYPTTEQELKALIENSQLTKITPRYFIDNCVRNAEINKLAKAKVRYNATSVGGSKLLLLAFHMPPLPEENGKAAKAWILDGAQGIRTIDMRDLPVGVYQFCALALNKNNQPTAKPNTDRFMVRYGGLEALVDYNDRRYLTQGSKSDKPEGFAELELADTIAETPLFKLVPATCVLRPGEHIVLTAEALPTQHERRIKRIHERYGLQAKESTQAEGAGLETSKKKRYVWAISGHGRLEVVNDNSAIYYAPNYDTTGAQISCREEGSDNVVTASMYVTTMPLGEMPRLEEFKPGL